MTLRIPFLVIIPRCKNLDFECRAWRAHLKEWLAIVAASKSATSVHKKQLKLAVASLLTDQDSGVQTAVLTCFKVCLNFIVHLSFNYSFIHLFTEGQYVKISIALQLAVSIKRTIACQLLYPRCIMY